MILWKTRIKTTILKPENLYLIFPPAQGKEVWPFLVYSQQNISFTSTNLTALRRRLLLHYLDSDWLILLSIYFLDLEGDKASQVWYAVFCCIIWTTGLPSILKSMRLYMWEKKQFPFLPMLRPSACSTFYAKLDDTFDLNNSFLY